MLNRVILIGRLTKQPELRVTPNGVPVATFGLAVDRRANQAGQREADFFDIVLFGRLAEVTAKYMDKGRQVAIEGRLQTRVYETKDGQRRKVWEVVGDNIQFLGSRQIPRGNDVLEDDIPPEPEDPSSGVEFTE
ncbi:MAG: single-stranded DNA-binding protein [Bacillota bacterium]